MSVLFSEQWILLTLGVLAITFNMYAIGASSGTYPMGTIVYKFRVYLELVNWIVLLGIIVYLGSLYTWWLLLSFFVFPIVGRVLVSVLGSVTQLVYMLGMPVFLAAEIIRLSSIVQQK